MATFHVPSLSSAEAATVVRVSSIASANTMLSSFFMFGFLLVHFSDSWVIQLKGVLKIVRWNVQSIS